MFSSEYSEIFKNRFFNRTTLATAYVHSLAIYPRFSKNDIIALVIALLSECQERVGLTNRQSWTETGAKFIG